MKFVSNSSPTVGIEEEFHLVDPATGELSSSASDILTKSCSVFGDRICHELFECIIESRTKVCDNIGQLYDDIITGRRKLAEAAENCGVKIAAAGSHPFSDWKKQTFVDADHYKWVEDQFNFAVHRLMAMGMHIHVGVKNDKAAFYVLQMMKRWTPALIALACNSPFFEGEDYGFKSTRLHLFHALPRTGFLPDLTDLDDYIGFYNKLKSCGDVRSMRDMWWSIRPKPEFGTVEFRLFDLPTDVNRAAAISALVQAAVSHYQNEYFNGVKAEACNPSFLNEAVWKSCRDGLDGHIIDPITEKVVSLKNMTQNLLETVRPEAKKLGSLNYFDMVEKEFMHSTEADCQKKILEENNGDMSKLELDIARRTLEG